MDNDEHSESGMELRKKTEYAFRDGQKKMNDLYLARSLEDRSGGILSVPNMKWQEIQRINLNLSTKKLPVGLNGRTIDK